MSVPRTLNLVVYDRAARSKIGLTVYGLTAEELIDRVKRDIGVGVCTRRSATGIAYRESKPELARRVAEMLKSPPAAAGGPAATIPLTGGEVALVDAVDVPALSAISWCLARGKNGKKYARGTIWDPESKRNRPVLMHRLLMGARRGQEVDHVHGNGLDNRRSFNLRVCTRLQNCRNRRGGKSRAGFKGVVPATNGGPNPWRAEIRVNGRKIHLGQFPTPDAAARAYDAAARKHFGDFAKPNFVQEAA